MMLQIEKSFTINHLITISTTTFLSSKYAASAISRDFYGWLQTREVRRLTTLCDEKNRAFARPLFSQDMMVFAWLAEHIRT